MEARNLLMLVLLPVATAPAYGAPVQSAGAIMAHIMLPKHPMPTIPLTKSELADLSAYILSLRQGE